MTTKLSVFLKISTVMAVIILAVLGVMDILEVFSSEEQRSLSIKTIKILGIFILSSLTVLIISKN